MKLRSLPILEDCFIELQMRLGCFVAVADNFGYFQPLGEAFKHITKRLGKTVQVF